MLVNRHYQGGGALIYPVLQSSFSVKVLTCVIFALTLDQEYNFVCWPLTKQLLLIALTQALKVLTLNLLSPNTAVGHNSSLFHPHPFQMGKVVHHDKLARVSYRQSEGTENI